MSHRRKAYAERCKSWRSIADAGSEPMDWYLRNVHAFTKRPKYELRWGKYIVATVSHELNDADLWNRINLRVYRAAFEEEGPPLEITNLRGTFDVTRLESAGREAVATYHPRFFGRGGELVLSDGRTYSWRQSGGGLFRRLRGWFTDRSGAALVRFEAVSRFRTGRNGLTTVIDLPGIGLAGMEALLLVGCYLLVPPKYPFGWKQFRLSSS